MRLYPFWCSYLRFQYAGRFFPCSSVAGRRSLWDAAGTSLFRSAWLLSMRFVYGWKLRLAVRLQHDPLPKQLPRVLRSVCL